MVNFARANHFNHKRNASGLVGDQYFLQLYNTFYCLFLEFLLSDL